jgi:hypothetical protein
VKKARSSIVTIGILALNTFVLVSSVSALRRHRHPDVLCPRRRRCPPWPASTSSMPQRQNPIPPWHKGLPRRHPIPWYPVKDW